jgi:hypothetical protein
VPRRLVLVYDSFVVRLWRDHTSSALQRVEIEHVQDGAIRTSRAVTPEWILDALGVRCETDGEAEDSRRSRKEQGDDGKG